MKMEIIDSSSGSNSNSNTVSQQRTVRTRTRQATSKGIDCISELPEDDMRVENNGQTPPLPQLFRETHCRKGTNEWINDVAREKYEELQRVTEEQSQSSVQYPLSEEEISRQVLGSRPGYVKGLGIHASISASASRARFAEEVEEQRAQVEEQRAQLEEQRAQLEAQLEEQRAQLEEQRKMLKEQNMKLEQQNAIIKKLASHVGMDLSSILGN